MAKAENKAVQDDIGKPVEGAGDTPTPRAATPELTAWLRNNVDAGNITLDEAKARMAAHRAASSDA